MTAPPSSHATHGRDHSEAHLVFFLASIGTLIALGIDVLFPAFDLIRDDFGLSEGAGARSLIVLLFFAGLAVGQPIYGPFADRFGRRPVLTVGLGIYSAGAVLATIAPTFEMLLAARVIWGIGAASCAALFPAMARDLYGGDHLARVMQLVTAVFLIGPLLAPFIGEALIATGWWRSVFISGVGFAAAACVWLWMFGETLPPERRRPLELHTLARSAKAILGTASTRRYMVAVMFADGAFYIHLGATQVIIDEIYGQGRWFAPIFSVFSLVLGVVLLFAHHMTFVRSARWVASAASRWIAGCGTVFLVVCLMTDGVPPFWVWIVLTAISISGMTVIRPTCVSLALEPLERMAATASGVIGAVSQGAGAAIATLVTSQISDDATPMAVGFVIYGVLCVLFVARAHTTSIGSAPSGSQPPPLRE